MSTNLPSPERCLLYLQHQGCSAAVIEHSLAVRDVAVVIAQLAHADIQLVEAGALLHDIGRSKTHGIHHAVEGVRIAKNLGLPEELIHIIERHIGAGILKEESKGLGLPEKEYLPQTLEEKIVTHADNLIDKGKIHPIEKEIEKAKKKGFVVLAQRIRQLHDELSEICGMDLNNIGDLVKKHKKET
jgi:tRNA (cytidine56-2'-O)-methyltransferase